MGVKKELKEKDKLNTSLNTSINSKKPPKQEQIKEQEPKARFSGLLEKKMKNKKWYQTI